MRTDFLAVRRFVFLWCVVCIPPGVATEPRIHEEECARSAGSLASVASCYSKMDEKDVDAVLDEKLGKQIFGVPTFDSTFKYVMGGDVALLEFIQLFSKIPGITSVTRMDEHLNPVKGCTKVRSFLSDSAHSAFMSHVRSSQIDEIRVAITVPPSLKRRRVGASPLTTAVESDDSPEGARFLRAISQVYADIKEHFPDPARDSRMDLVCELSDGNYSLVEVQVATQDYWDKRALAYAAAFFGNQLKRGGKWENLKSVVAINLLGKGQKESNPWSDHPDESVRHYVFQDIHNVRAQKIEDLQLIQYCVPHLRNLADHTDHLTEWAEFFQSAQEKTDEDLKHVTSRAVREAYERARVRNMPLAFKRAYLEDYTSFGNYTQQLAKSHKEGVAEGEALGEARGMEKGRMKTILENTKVLRVQQRGDEAVRLHLSTFYEDLSEEEIKKLVALTAAEIDDKLQDLGGAVIVAGSAAESAGATRLGTS